MKIQIFDLIVFIMTIYLCYEGFSQGLLDQILAILSIIFIFIFGYALSPMVAGFFIKYEIFRDKSSPYLIFFSYVIACIIIYFISKIIRSIVYDILKAFFILGFLDSLAGMLIGFIYSFLFAFILVFLIKNQSFFDFTNITHGSVIYQKLEPIVSNFDISEHIKKFI